VLLVNGLVQHLDKIITSHEASQTPFHDLFAIQVHRIGVCDCEENFTPLYPEWITEDLYVGIRSTTGILNNWDAISGPQIDETSIVCSGHRHELTTTPCALLKCRSHVKIKGSILLLIYDQVPDIQKTEVSFSPPVTTTTMMKWHGDIWRLGPNHDCVYGIQYPNDLRGAETGKIFKPSPIFSSYPSCGEGPRPFLSVYCLQNRPEASNQVEDTRRESKHEVQG
jgi:hypothetical protein